jgi:hypothetical protein
MENQTTTLSSAARFRIFRHLYTYSVCTCMSNSVAFSNVRHPSFPQCLQPWKVHIVMTEYTQRMAVRVHEVSRSNVSRRWWG